MCDHVRNSHNHSVLQALILQGEIWCWSLLGLEGLTFWMAIDQQENDYTRAAEPWKVIRERDPLNLLSFLSAAPT